MLPYLISHLNMRISSNARIPPSGYMQNILEYKAIRSHCFSFTNGFDAQYTKWADGYRIRVNGNNVSWIKSAQPDTSYDSLKDYLRIVFLMPVPPPWIPKHSRSRYLICRWEMCFKRRKSGACCDGRWSVRKCRRQKAFLLAQGYMPAQQFHVLKIRRTKMTHGIMKMKSPIRFTRRNIPSRREA